jgi:hypothetical protein
LCGTRDTVEAEDFSRRDRQLTAEVGEYLQLEVIYAQSIENRDKGSVAGREMEYKNIKVRQLGKNT